MIRPRTRPPVRFFEKQSIHFDLRLSLKNAFHARLPSNMEVGQFKSIAHAMRTDTPVKHSACHEK